MWHSLINNSDILPMDFLLYMVGIYAFAYENLSESNRDLSSFVQLVALCLPDRIGEAIYLRRVAIAIRRVRATADGRKR